MADEQNVILSDQADGEVNGLSVRNVRGIVAMLAKMGATLMRSNMVLPEEVASAFATASANIASAFATASANIAAIAYLDIADARKLLGLDRPAPQHLRAHGE